MSAFLAPAVLLIATALLTAWRVNHELGDERRIARYVIALLIAATFTGAALAFGAAPLDAACLGAIATLCAGIALVDSRTLLIPDVLVGALLFVAIIMPAAPPVMERAIGALALGGLFLLVRQIHAAWRGEEGLGLGDVKMATVMGALFGASAALVAVAGAALITAAWLIFSTNAPRTDNGRPAAAFGVGLALASVATAVARASAFA